MRIFSIFHDIGNICAMKSLRGIKVVNSIGITNCRSPLAHPSITMQNILNALFPNCIITQT